MKRSDIDLDTEGFICGNSVNYIIEHDFTLFPNVSVNKLNQQEYGINNWLEMC